MFLSCLFSLLNIEFYVITIFCGKWKILKTHPEKLKVLNLRKLFRILNHLNVTWCVPFTFCRCFKIIIKKKAVAGKKTKIARRSLLYDIINIPSSSEIWIIGNSVNRENHFSQNKKEQRLYSGWLFSIMLCYF